MYVNVMYTDSAQIFYNVDAAAQIQRSVLSTGCEYIHRLDHYCRVRGERLYQLIVAH